MALTCTTGFLGAGGDLSVVGARCLIASSLPALGFE